MTAHDPLGKRRTKLRSVVRWTAALAAVIVLVGGARYVYWARVDHRLTEVSAGRLYQSAAMPAEDLAEVAREHGLRSVVDLRAADEGGIRVEDERRVLEGLGVRYLHLPFKQIPTDDTVDAFVRFASDESNLPLLVHCYHGMGRSVLAGAIYRIELEGWDPEDARRGTGILSFRGAFGADGSKGSYLRAYTPHLAGLAAAAGSEDREQPREPSR